MSADLWGMVNAIVLPNSDDYNADVGDSSSGIKGGEGDDDSAVPLPPPPPPSWYSSSLSSLMPTPSSLLPAVAPVNRGILPPLGGNTW